MRRGRWLYHPKIEPAPGISISAWELEGTDWYLIRHTGVMRIMKWCPRCYPFNEPYRRWLLVREKPENWIWASAPEYWPHLTPDQVRQYPCCTHRNNLAVTMAACEKAYDEAILRSLAAIGESKRPR